MDEFKKVQKVYPKNVVVFAKDIVDVGGEWKELFWNT
jgi:hypothetical protein